MALDLCLKQLPYVLKQTEGGVREPIYEPSSFFADQLTAFSVWLGENSLLTTTSDREAIKQPEQLPIVLQVRLNRKSRLYSIGNQRTNDYLGTTQSIASSTCTRSIGAFSRSWHLGCSFGIVCWHISLCSSSITGDQ
jgi:hypothetical protein